MKKKLIFMLTALATFGLAAVAMAQTDPTVHAAALKTAGTVALAAAIAISMGALGTGIAAGLAIKSALEGIARNPEVSNKLTVTMVIGLAIIESLAIYTLVISLIIIYGFPLSKGIQTALGM